VGRLRALPWLFVATLSIWLGSRPIHASAGQCGGYASPAPSPSATAAVVTASPRRDRPLYQMADQIFTVDRDGTLYYYFQANRAGTAKAKREIRYGRNLWNDCAQLRIRIPVLTRYPLRGNPHAGLGNIELGYSYNVKGSFFDHSTEVRIAAPTATNNVQSLDTRLKVFYITKWRWPGGALSYANEYDQTIVRPPGSSRASYYEGKLQVPEYGLIPEVPGLKLSALYDYRVLVDRSGLVRDAVGATLFGNINDVALSITDTWGLGTNALWKYRFEANATARF